MDYNETDALLEEKLDRKLEEEIQKEGEQNTSSSDVNSLNKTLLKLLKDGALITKPSFYRITGSMTLAQRIYDVKKLLSPNFKICSRRAGRSRLSYYWLERIKTKTLDDIIWEKV